MREGGGGTYMRGEEQGGHLCRYIPSSKCKGEFCFHGGVGDDGGGGE